MCCRPQRRWKPLFAGLSPLDTWEDGGKGTGNLRKRKGGPGKRDRERRGGIREEGGTKVAGGS
eukprot:1336915-Rhodomonas_salina.3